MDFSFELLSREERCLEISPNQGKSLWRGILDKFNRHFHSIGSHLSSIRSYFYSIGSYLSSIRSYFHSIGSYLSSIRSYFHSIGSYLPFNHTSIGSYLSSIRSYFNYFVASFITLVYSLWHVTFILTSVETAFHRIVTIVRP